MIRALKNDILALEFPINHFIGQCIRNGEWPVWFNTWGMGFPLQSNLTWGIFSTPQVAFSSLLPYNIYTLHIEFLFYILLAGWGMFYLLRRFILSDERIALLLSIAYMLSGFMVGSSQWLLYITAASFLPVFLSSLLTLLQAPSAGNAFQAAVIYTLMFTSVYAAFNIVSTYGVAVFLLYYLIRHRNDAAAGSRIRYLLLAGVLTLLLCLPCLYFTAELLGHMDRGVSIRSDTAFFQSNYLHPGALSGLLFPFSTVRMAYPNTEGTMLDLYPGLFVILLLPALLATASTEKNKPALVMGAVALLFLLIAFGHLTPVRQWLNILPGFSYFRNPALFRFYFIFCWILFTALSLKNKAPGILFTEKSTARLLNIMLILLAAACLLALVRTAGSLRNLDIQSPERLIRNIRYSQTVAVSAIIQLVLLASIFFFLRRRKWKVLPVIFAADLVLQTLLCTPFYTVSSYSLSRVNRILKSQPGFPVQPERVSDVPAIFRDEKGNTWQNVNIYSKKVSSQESYRGPLLLKQDSDNSPDSGGYFHRLVFLRDDSSGSAVNITLQRPTHVRAVIQAAQAGQLTLLQQDYPGWKVLVNQETAEKIKNGKPGITVAVPAGNSTADFIYERKSAKYAAFLLHGVVLLFGAWKIIRWRKQTVNRSSSLS